MLRKSFFWRTHSCEFLELFRGMHRDVIRRSGNPTEITKQAAFIALENAHLICPKQISRENVRELAAIAAVLFRSAAPSVTRKLLALYRDYLEAEEHSVSLPACACIIDSTLDISGKSEPLGVLLKTVVMPEEPSQPPDIDTQNQEEATRITELAFRKGSKIAMDLHRDFIKTVAPEALKNQISSKSILALLRAGHYVHSPNPANFSTFFGFWGDTTFALFPIKTHLLSEAKLHKVQNARTLLAILAELPQNKIDAQSCLTLFAGCGFFHEGVLNKSCQVLEHSVAAMQPLQVVRCLFALGVLNHRHVLQDVFFLHVGWPKLSDEGFRLCVISAAMLHHPLRREALRLFKDRLWATLKRQPLTVTPDWIVDILHAMDAMELHDAKVLIHCSRVLWPHVADLDDFYFVKLLFAYRRLDKAIVDEKGDSTQGTQQPPPIIVRQEFWTNWRKKVLRLRMRLINEAKTLREADSPESNSISGKRDFRHELRPLLVRALMQCGVTEKDQDLQLLIRSIGHERHSGQR